MSAKKSTHRKLIDKFIQQNRDINLKTVSLIDADEVEGLSWKGLKKHREEILKDLQAYQRLCRIIPDEKPDIIFALLEKQVHSALQIAAIPRVQFFNTYSNIFGNDRDLIERTYQNALAVRAAIVRQYLTIKQNNEPHIKQTKITHYKRE